MKTFGVDLSHWNDPVRDLHPDVSFVIHKVTEGATYQDPNYLKNRSRIVAPVLWGAYHLIRESSTWNDQFNNFHAHAKIRPFDIVAVDLEHKWAEAMVKQHGAGASLAGLIHFGKLCYVAYNVRPLLYASERSLSEIIGDIPGVVPVAAAMMLAEFYDLWLVDHEECLIWKKIKAPVLRWWPCKPIMRQYTSDGSGGVIGNPDDKIDHNVCFDYASLNWHAVKNVDLEVS